MGFVCMEMQKKFFAMPRGVTIQCFGNVELVDFPTFRIEIRVRLRVI